MGVPRSLIVYAKVENLGMGVTKTYVTNKLQQPVEINRPESFIDAMDGKIKISK